MSGGSTLPRVVTSPAELQALTRLDRRSGLRVGFVPTMGALHPGHLRLVEVAHKLSDVVIVSIFVNPTQFGPDEDLDRYPRDLEGDLSACREAGVQRVYTPPVEVMYPQGADTVITLRAMTVGLCGPHRHGHFDGVATIVTKLLNQVGPCVALFGRKDYQQLKVITQVVRDLDLEVEVVGVDTVREPDGLALSSRNAYLTFEERRRALSLVMGLSAAWRHVERTGELATAAAVRSLARAPIEEQLDRVDYVEVCDPETLEPLADDARISGPALVAMAGWLGRTRLIDNIVLKEQPDPLDQR